MAIQMEFPKYSQMVAPNGSHNLDATTFNGTFWVKHLTDYFQLLSNYKFLHIPNDILNSNSNVSVHIFHSNKNIRIRTEQKKCEPNGIFSCLSLQAGLLV